MQRTAKLISEFELSDEQWKRIKVVIPSSKKGRPRINDRLVLTAIFLVLIEGVEWKNIPEKYGRWKTIYARFCKWCADGTLTRILEELNPEYMEAALKSNRVKYLYNAGVVEGSCTVSTQKEEDRFRRTDFT